MSVLFGDPEPEPVRWTERTMLDLLRQRHAKDGGNGPRYVYAEHVRSESGFGPWDRPERLRTADAIAVDLWPSRGNAVHGFEVKVSRSDWLTERRDPSKAEAVKRYCNHWWLVVPDAEIAHDGLPDGWGLLALGSGGVLRVRKSAPALSPEPMSPSFIAALLRAAVRTADRERSC